MYINYELQLATVHTQGLEEFARFESGKNFFSRNVRNVPKK